MKTELKPCPFCGGKAEQHKFGTDLTIMTEAWNGRINKNEID